jgi:hypothetical protein
VFGSGPHAIDVAAGLGDKTTVAVGAEPERIEWAVRTAREARRTAGLDPQAIDIGAFVVVGAGTDQRELDELRRGNASISAHFQRDVTSSLSRSDATVVEEVTSRYDNYHHGLEHASQAEVIPADFLSRFCVIGSPDAFTERLCRLVDLDPSHLVIVGGSRDIDATVRERSDHLVAREVLPAVKAIALPGKPAKRSPHRVCSHGQRTFLVPDHQERQDLRLLARYEWEARDPPERRAPKGSPESCRGWTPKGSNSHLRGPRATSSGATSVQPAN